MGKLKCLFLMLMLLSVVACQKAKTGVVDDSDQQKTNTGEDATVKSVGADINNADSVDKDLSADNLSDLDSGLADVENI